MTTEVKQLEVQFNKKVIFHKALLLMSDLKGMDPLKEETALPVIEHLAALRVAYEMLTQSMGLNAEMVIKASTDLAEEVLVDVEEEHIAHCPDCQKKAKEHKHERLDG